MVMCTSRSMVKAPGPSPSTDDAVLALRRDGVARIRDWGVLTDSIEKESDAVPPRLAENALFHIERARGDGALSR